LEQQNYVFQQSLCHLYYFLAGGGGGGAGLTFNGGGDGFRPPFGNSSLEGVMSIGFEGIFGINYSSIGFFGGGGIGGGGGLLCCGGKGFLPLSICW
jgi:hypothetical protein